MLISSRKKSHIQLGKQSAPPSLTSSWLLLIILHRWHAALTNLDLSETNFVKLKSGITSPFFSITCSRLIMLRSILLRPRITKITADEATMGFGTGLHPPGHSGGVVGVPIAIGEWMSSPESPSFDSFFLVRGLSLVAFCVGVNFLSVLGFFVLRTVGFLVGELQ